MMPSRILFGKLGMSLLLLTKAHTHKKTSLIVRSKDQTTHRRFWGFLHYVCATKRKCFVAGSKWKYSPPPMRKKTSPNINSNVPIPTPPLFWSYPLDVGWPWHCFKPGSLSSQWQIHLSHNTIAVSDGSCSEDPGWMDGSGKGYPTDVCDMWVTILLVTNWTGQRCTAEIGKTVLRFIGSTRLYFISFSLCVKAKR